MYGEAIFGIVELQWNWSWQTHNGLMKCGL